MNSIEEDMEVLESIVKVNNDFLRGIENQTINQKEITALQHILSDYKKLQEEFKQVDHECDRLEKIDFEKDMKIKELQKKNEELKGMKAITEESNKYILKSKIKNMIKEKEWALENYDCDKSDYKQSQAIGAWNILQKILKESEE